MLPPPGVATAWGAVMPYLIDGYNLLYAMGVLHGRVGPGGLEKARRALLGLLHGTYGPQSSVITVVFDAAQAPRGAEEEEDYHGIRVRFAVHQEAADDLIELLIRHDASPRQLTVVSDDHRLQQAARHRHCVVVGCLEFLDELDRWRRRRRDPSETAPEKQDRVSQEELGRWLREFGDLDNDPDMKELFHPYDFGPESGAAQE